MCMQPPVDCFIRCSALAQSLRISDEGRRKGRFRGSKKTEVSRVQKKRFPAQSYRHDMTTTFRWLCRLRGRLRVLLHSHVLQCSSTTFPAGEETFPSSHPEALSLASRAGSCDKCWPTPAGSSCRLEERLVKGRHGCGAGPRPGPGAGAALSAGAGGPHAPQPVRPWPAH